MRRFIHALAGASAVLLASAALGPLAAQSPTADERLLFQDVSHVTGVSRFEQDTREAPASITVITAADIEHYGFRTISEALASVRGLHVMYDRNYTYVGVRGILTPGDYNGRLLFLLDGHRINDNISDLAYVGTEAALDIGIIERIEVIRGPASSLYGTNAMLGVVNIVTRAAGSIPGARIRAEAGTFGTREASFEAGGRIGRVRFLGSASSYRSDGPDLYFPGLDSQATNFGRAVGVDGDGVDRLFAKLSLDEFSLTAGMANRRKEIPTGSYESVFNDPQARTRDARTYVRLALGHGFADGARFDASAAWDYSAYYDWLPYAGSGVLHDYDQGAWGTLAAQYRRNLGTRHLLIAGAELRRNERMTQVAALADSATEIFRDEHHNTVWALYAQDAIRLLPRLTMTAGLRLDHLPGVGHSWNPRLAVVRAIGQTGAVKLLYGRAFRAPNRSELAYNDGGLTQKTPVGLGPEHVHSLEAVVEGSLGSGIRFTATAYQFTLEELVALVTDPADSLLVYQNSDTARTRGVELEVTGRSARGWEGTISGAMQRAEDPRTHTRLANAPQFLVSARGSLPLAAERLRIGLVARLVGAQWSPRGTQCPASVIADFTAQLRLPGERLQVEAKVRNLFDTRFDQPAGLDQVVDAIPQDGRTARVAVRVRL